VNGSLPCFDLDQRRQLRSCGWAYSRALHATARWLLLGENQMMKSLGKKMMRTVRYRAIAAIIPACLLSVVMLIFADNVAQAKSRTAAACGKELQSQCIGTPSFGSNMLACLAKAQVSARCRAVAQNVVRSCERDAVQFCQGVAFGQGNILGCLTAARGVVSAPCNAALNAVFVR